MNFTKPNGKRRVVITGGSMISGLGRDWETAYANLKAGKNKIRYMPEWERFTKMNTRLACPYDGELPTFPRKKIRGMGRVALLSLVTTSEALKDAGLLTEDGEDVIEELKIAQSGKDDFVANVSHEIRTPINTIIGMNEMILRT